MERRGISLISTTKLPLYVKLQTLYTKVRWEMKGYNYTFNPAIYLTRSCRHFHNLGISFILSIAYYEKYFPCSVAPLFGKRFCG